MSKEVLNQRVPWHIKTITGYNRQSLPVLQKVARLKFGESSASREVVGELSSFLRTVDLPFQAATVVNPCTKGLIPRPIVSVGKEIAEAFGMQFLSSINIIKNKPDPEKDYASLADAQNRLARRSGRISIEKGSISTPFALIIDDTYATGATIIEYARAIAESNPIVSRVWALAYARYKTADFSIEDINNGFLIWDLPQAANLINNAKYMSNTAFRVLLKLSDRVFARLISQLFPEVLARYEETWLWFLNANSYPHRSAWLKEKVDIMQGKHDFSERVSLKRPRAIGHWSMRDILLFSSLREFRLFQSAVEALPLKNSDFVIVEEKAGFRPVRFMSGSRDWVPELNNYGSLSSLLERTLMGVISND
jgi:hypothetical protein